jgi:hypothetical protein
MRRVDRARLTLLLPLVTALYSGPAAAEATPPVEPAPAPPKTATADALPPAGDSLGPVERLPPSAYPNKPIRGLEGGSLWLNNDFNGLQWPYYPKTGIGVSGYVWIDGGYETISRGNPSEQGINYLLQQGRFLLRATPTWSDGRWFVQGQAEIVANKDQTASAPLFPLADDVWVRVGRWNTFDLQLGRYQAWEIYHFGMGLDLNTLERNGAIDGSSGYTVPSIYGVTYAFYRPAGVGGAAIHLYPAESVRFELGTQFGNEAGANVLAGRPVAVLDLGWLKFKVGGEWKRQTDQAVGGKGSLDQRGAGAALQFVVDPHVEFGANAAYGWFDHTSSVDGSFDTAGSGTNYSLGAFANARIVPPIRDLLVGGGLNYTYLQDKHYDPTLRRDGNFDHWQGFGAVQYVLFKQLYIKVVGGYALANLNPTFTMVNPYFNTMYSARLRLMYLF